MCKCILFLFFCLTALAAPNPANFKVDVLAEGFVDPQEFVMLPDGRILICERTGGIEDLVIIRT